FECPRQGGRGLPSETLLPGIALLCLPDLGAEHVRGALLPGLLLLLHLLLLLTLGHIVLALALGLAGLALILLPGLRLLSVLDLLPLDPLLLLTLDLGLALELLLLFLYLLLPLVHSLLLEVGPALLLGLAGLLSLLHLHKLLA